MIEMMMDMTMGLSEMLRDRLARRGKANSEQLL